MKMLVSLLLTMMIFAKGRAEDLSVWRIYTDSGELLTEICYEPQPGDCYINAANACYEVYDVIGSKATAKAVGKVDLPRLDWLDIDQALPVSSISKRISIYCTHSDESYEPSDGTYTSNERGSIYEVAKALASGLQNRGIEAEVSDNLHHPHDAGAYRRSRQTAVQMMKNGVPDALIDIHRDGIPDPSSYQVTIGGKEVSKIRLLVGRGNQNAETNKEFALMIKAVGDRLYPGLIKDIYMGKGVFNQDLLPHSLLFECGTYTLEKDLVMASMHLLADVLDRSLYGGVTGSAGRITSDTGTQKDVNGSIVQGVPDAPITESSVGTGHGLIYLGGFLLIGIVGIAWLACGSTKVGMKKITRNIHEMTGGLVGKKPEDNETHDHS